MSKVLGYELWKGKSWIDGNEIICIATGFSGSSNRKTGDMIQTYILPTGASPVQAVKSGLDRSVCGDCVHRGSAGDGSGRTCYVNLGQGPRSVYDAWTRGRYETKWDADTFKDRIVRLGTYGDPAVIPMEIWDEVLRLAKGNTGYTHQWSNTASDPKIGTYCMASVDSESEKAAAHRLGFRTFRVAPPTIRTNPETVSPVRSGIGESLCPASEEAGKKLQCETCLACSGTRRGLKGSIMIPAHGPAPVMKNMRERHAL